MRNSHPMLRSSQDNFYQYLRKGTDVISQSIIPMKSVDVDGCLEIYRKGYFARLTEALGETFEATWWVLGDEDFFKICHDYISSYESKSFDLSDYGMEFPDFLGRTPQATEAPFLKDLATFEWAFKEVFHQTNLAEEPGLLQNEIAKNPEVRFKLSSSARLFESEYSIYEIWKLRREKIEEITELNFSNLESSVIYKSQYLVFVKYHGINEFAVLKTLVSGV
ncbi:MAG: putative DNA-binding domain-containing protein, partial [Bdellovibrionales bacterium]